MYTSIRWPLYVAALLNNPLFALPETVSINGTSIRNLLSPVQSVTVSCEDSPICLFSDNGYITIGPLTVSKEMIQAIKEVYSEVSSFPLGDVHDTCILPFISTFYEEHRLMLIGDNFFGTTNAYQTFKRTIFNKPPNKFIGKQFFFQSCYFEQADELIICSEQEDALFQTITLTFASHCSLPYMICGSINLETGNTRFPLIIVGANKIEISLNNAVVS